jgi:hypothetical protein
MHYLEGGKSVTLKEIQGSLIDQQLSLVQDAMEMNGFDGEAFALVVAALLRLADEDARLEREIESQHMTRIEEGRL